ncbi:MAG: hypothetical protein P8N14_06295 [Sulfitobacter sp.]|nr:hypothetical protein [Sulfitobacter sp.]
MLCTSAQANVAAGFLYECDIAEPERGQGWISPKIAIVLPAQGEVQVVDALTLAFSPTPVIATILRDDAKRLTLKWSLQNVRADNGRSFAYFDYRASIAKATGRMELTAGPRSFDTGLRGTGLCRKRSE